MSALRLRADITGEVKARVNDVLAERRRCRVAAIMKPNLNGKRVHVMFREVMHNNGVDVVSMVGTCGGVTPQFFALNDVTKAFGPGDVDVTDRLGIRGKATLFSTRMIQFVIASDE